MRKKLIKIRKSDHLRSLLTETLPYEVPLPFSNEGLYEFIKTNQKDAFKTKVNPQLDLLTSPKFTIPYTFKIRKSPSEYRALSIMHPSMQIEVAEFYKKYSSMILAQCKKSSWSLRAPSVVASYYIEKSRVAKTTAGKSGAVEQANSGFDTLAKTASSYFAYRPYSLLHRFIDSSEFHKLERRHEHLLKLDISQCFGRIYTHTIAWAIKSKEHAKNNKDPNARTFESAFDKLMQRANYDETAGILVGPEISRIFAEIILQQIDLDIEQSLTNAKNPLHSGKDYDIRRYVDDYFVFARSIEILRRIQLIITECLKPYRLSLNESKSAEFQRPFSSPETTARPQVVKILTDFFEKAETSEDFIDATTGAKKKVYRPTRLPSADRLSNTIIRDIKIALKSSDISFDTVSNYFFATAKRLAHRYTSRIEASKLEGPRIEWALNFLTSIINTVFFFYSNSPRVRQTYLVSEILLILIDYAQKLPPGAKQRLLGKISLEIDTFITDLHQDSDDNIEATNLLFVHCTLGNQYQLSLLSLSKALGFNVVDNQPSIPTNFGYFQIVSSLYVNAKTTNNSSIIKLLVKHTTALYKEDPHWVHKAELVMLLLDISVCRSIPSSDRKKVIRTALEHLVASNNLGKATTDFESVANQKRWFFNWNQQIELSDVLRRKELKTPY